MTHDSKLNRKESYKAQRKSYRMEKKRVAAELMNSIQDPTVVVLEDWLKVRGTLKSWTKLWCVLKPGLLLIYKSQKAKSSHWVGTVLLTSCQVIERPSKKDGFCFKLFHPLDQSIWAPKGPERETMGRFLWMGSFLSSYLSPFEIMIRCCYSATPNFLSDISSGVSGCWEMLDGCS